MNRSDIHQAHIRGLFQSLPAFQDARVGGDNDNRRHARSGHRSRQVRRQFSYPLPRRF